MNRQTSGTASAQRGRVLPDPAIVRDLLADIRFAPLWLVVRVTFGWLLLEAGWFRLQGLSWPDGQQVIAAASTGPGDPLAVGLTLSGIALILGVLTGPAAFVGGSLSAGFWAGGDVPLATLGLAAVIWLALAWKTAGWIGIDRWLLPLLGLPWRGGEILGGRPAHERGTSDRRRR